MVRTPQSLDEAKQIYREEKSKVVASANAIAGSRWLMAILATLVLAFGTHLAYAPARLPNVSGLSLAQIGLPSSVDFGFAGEQAKAAREAAVREGARERARDLIDTHRDAVPVLNAVGFGACLALLLANMWVMTKRRRFTRG